MVIDLNGIVLTTAIMVSDTPYVVSLYIKMRVGLSSISSVAYIKKKV